MDQAQNLRELVGRGHEIRVISVAGGKGGVGKSSIAANLAVAMSRLGVRALVLDADLGLANGSGVNELLSMNEAQLSELLRNVVHIDEPIDVIVVDAGTGVSDITMEVLLASSETIVVTTPEPASVLDSYALIKTIVKHSISHPLHLLVEKCENMKESQNAQIGIINVCEKHLGKRINALGVISYNYNVTKGIDEIAQQLIDMPRKKASHSALSRVFSRLFQA